MPLLPPCVVVVAVGGAGAGWRCASEAPGKWFEVGVGVGFRV